MRVVDVRTHGDGMVLGTTNGSIRLQQISDRVVRVTYTTRDRFGTRASLGVVPQQPTAPAVEEDGDRVTVSTPALRVVVDRATGAFSWHSAEGELLVQEPHNGRDTKVLEEVDVVLTRFDPDSPRVTIPGADGTRTVATGGTRTVDRRAYATTLRLELSPGEAVYGLGQHEDGILNYRGHSQELYQQNMKVAIPVLVSTRGYGIVWDTFSAARFADGPDGASFHTDVDDEMDYYVVLGPELDQVVAGIRELTGRVPMLPRWALGYLQSKERYRTQQELLDVVAEFRRRRIPIDGIVQDWMTWPGELWGQKSFDPSRYPDPTELVRRLHDQRVRLMVSVWPNMHHDGPDQEAMREHGFLLGDESTYDARSPEARALYWQQANDGYFRHGVDAWWADCTEPFEADWTGAVKRSEQVRRETNVEMATRYLDPEDITAYSFLHTQGLYEGQRSTDEAKRVFVLTRSASLGQQRYGAVTWSGDISATWEVLRRQIPEGLSFCLTGNPRWSVDIGAFFVGSHDDEWFHKGDFPGGVEDLGYRELYVRWLQLGTFLPLMRSHGTETPREPWRFGEPGATAYDTIVDFIRLRHRLLPYLYSLHAAEHRHHSTSMRALAFDFRHDPLCFDIDDQFLLGPALLVCPVAQPMEFGPGSTPIVGGRQTRPVYLPAGTDWFDFWTGRSYAGGQVIEADAPVQRLPLFLRAGSILPLGPVVEDSAASLAGPLEIRVYPGADGSFELYDDAGDGYAYESGEFATTALRWNDGARTLDVSPRIGDYDGMPARVPGSVVVVGEDVGTGHETPEGVAVIIGPEADQARFA